MIPVLGVPFLNRPDLLLRMVSTVDVEIGRLVVVDNGAWGTLPKLANDHFREVVIIRSGRNLGVAASWNLIIKATVHAPWWAFAASDITYAPGGLSILESYMTKPGAGIAAQLGFSGFGITADAVQRAGWFDENFIPAYAEDNDYVWRCHLANVHIDGPIPGGGEHFGSATIKSDPALRRENDRTYPENLAYYRRKWGGLPGNETFRSPFNRGGPPSEWTLDLGRLARLSWR